MSSVLCAGVITADLVFQVDAMPQQPQKYRARQSTLTSGGCALNAAIAIARLGGSAWLTGTVGADALGSLVREELAVEGVVTDLLVCAEGVATGRSAVLVGPDGERTIVNHRDPQLFDMLPLIPQPWPFAAALADTRWPRGAAAVLRGARDAGCPAVLDAEMPVAEAGDALQLATHVAFSEQGLADWIGADDADVLAADLPGALAQAAGRLDAWVCVTRGAKPVLVHDGATLTEVPACAVTAVDTLGAGDVWHGAFTLFLAEGLPALAAVHRANAVAALKTTAFGGRDALPSRQQLNDFLGQHSR